MPVHDHTEGSLNVTWCRQKEIVVIQQSWQGPLGAIPGGGLESSSIARDYIQSFGMQSPL